MGAHRRTRRVADGPRRQSAGLLAVRYGFPAVVALVGVVLAAIGGDATRGAGIVHAGIGGILVLVNLKIRHAIQSQDERDREDERRRFYDEHGRWPRS
jgi:hypothetical protein